MNMDTLHRFLNDPEAPEADKEAVEEALTILDNYVLAGR